MIHPDIIKAFILFQKNYPSWNIEPQTLDIWSALLYDVPPPDFLRAAVEWCRQDDHAFPPTVGQIRALALRPNQEQLSPEEAWGEVRSEIKRVGWNGEPRFSTDAIKRAADALGSWRTLCSQTTDQIAANRAHFFRLYEAYARKATRVADQKALGPILDLLGSSGATMTQTPEQMYGVTQKQLDEEVRAEQPNSEPAEELYSEAEKARARELGMDL